jgi:hypothetical protein
MAGYLGIRKLLYINQNLKAPLITDSPFFFIALTVMIIGSFLFLTGFLAELLITRSSYDRNRYLIKDKVNMNHFPDTRYYLRIFSDLTLPDLFIH